MDGLTARPAVLVVDDEESARLTMAALLKVDPLELRFARDGVEAVSALESSPVDLIVSDVLMPELDGFGLCHRVRAHADWRFIPIILVTALDGHDDMVRGLEAGADEFLTKPVERVVLRARVRAMLRIRERFSELRTRAGDLSGLLRQRREDLCTTAALTAREREVLELLLLGRTYPDIGTVLGITSRTAKFHAQRIFQKLGADSRVDLIRLFG